MVWVCYWSQESYLHPKGGESYLGPKSTQQGSMSLKVAFRAVLALLREIGHFYHGEMDLNEALLAWDSQQISWWYGT